MKFPINTVATSAFMLMTASCTVEKSPPMVAWIQPASPIMLEDGQTVDLKFKIEDQSPTRGRTTTGSWRVEVGPPGGGTWWTRSGMLTETPGSSSVIDTIALSWEAVAPSSWSGAPSELLISAIATDGEGQSGADFASATWQEIPLTSSGLWWPVASDGGGLGHALTPSPSAVSTYPGTEPASHLVFLDGMDLLVTGGEEALTGWPLTEDVPTTSASWTANVPAMAAEGGLRSLRRASPIYASTAWAESVWNDRCLWHDAQGTLQRSWLLDAGESMLDAGTIGGEMVALARTDGGEFRLIRFNIDTGVRLGSITWTPTATGSLGPNAKGWLADWNGLPSALESDGTIRTWDIQGGATPISTSDLPGEGSITAAGRMDDGTTWVSRESTLFQGTDGTQIGQWENPANWATRDRAQNRIWVLSDEGEQAKWFALDQANFNPLGSPIQAGPDACGGSIGHNRPGPP